MGQSSSGPCLLTKEQIDKLATESTFSSQEIRALWFHFMQISGSVDKISRDRFQAAMLFSDSALLDRIFRVFDDDDDNCISFPEYISCLSLISHKASSEEKLKLGFKIYDFDADGKISAADLTSMVAATLREHGLVISRADIDLIVKNTMETSSLADTGFMTYEEYLRVVTSKPQLLSHLTINISSVIGKYSTATGIVFNTPRP